MKTEAVDKAPLMLEVDEINPVPSCRDLVDDNVFLLGRPPLQQFLNFVTGLSVDRELANSRELIEDWHAASEYISKLEEEEGGWADDPPIARLDPSLEPLRKALLADPIFQHSFNTVPTDIGVVELDRLVVYQKRINLEYSRQLKSRLSASLSDEEVFKFCLPFDHPQPPVKWMRIHRDTFAFSSPSNDLRYLGTMFLRPENIVGHPPPGAIVGVVGLVVGFGSNFLNAIHVENRLVLNNGSHRAFTLRELGITHVPCIIQHVSSREELNVITSSDLKRNPDRYLKHPRPSVLKDYFDPMLRKVVPVPRRLRHVRLKFSSDEADVPTM